MFGYVAPFIPELKVKDNELYRSYYCGLCRALGRYGLGSKMTLTYDATFAAVLLSGVLGREPSFERHACAVHPARGRVLSVAYDDVLDACAGVCVLLAKYKLLDDAEDGRPLRKAALPLFSRGVRRAEKKYPETAAVLKTGLKRLAEVENKPECDPDEAPLLFGELLGGIFASFPALPEEDKPLFEELGRKLGGFIYVADAWDDRAEDEKRGCYNIFLRSRMEDPRETCAAMLDMYINSAVLAYDLLDIKTNKALLDNIMYMGLGYRAAEVLRGKARKKDHDGKEDAANGSL